MSAALTPFQLWTLFLMFKDTSVGYTSRDLLVKCCDTAIETLSEGDAKTQISGLRSAGYTVDNTLDALFTKQPIMHQISDDGILYVRKNLLSIQDACNRDAIPEPVINAQDMEVAEALRSKSSNMAKIILEHGIKNIGGITKLFEACVLASGAA